MIDDLSAWADERVALLATMAGVLLLIALREWMIARRRMWSLRLTGIDRLDSASGVHSYTSAASVVLPSELAVAEASKRSVCVLLLRVDQGDPAVAARFLADRSRRYEHVVRVEYHLIASLLLVQDRTEGVLAAARLLQGLDAGDLPFTVREAGVAMAPEDGADFLELTDEAAKRFLPIGRFENVADLARRAPGPV